MEYKFTGTTSPWRWEMNLKHKQIQLCGGKPTYDLTVIDFARWGMNRATPRFRTMDDGLNIMKPANTWTIVAPGREHHQDWFQLIDHPDANLIAAAPDLLNAAIKLEEKLSFTRMHVPDALSVNIREAHDELISAIKKALNIQ